MRISRAIVLAAVAFAALALAPVSVGPGQIVVWGTDQLAQEGAEPGNFVSLAAGGALQTLAIREDGTLYQSGGTTGGQPGGTGGVPEIPSTLRGLQFSAVGMGRNHGLAIRLDGGIETWEKAPGAATSGTPTTGQFVAVTGGGPHSVALDTDGNVVLWGGFALSAADRQAVVGVGAPSRIKFKAIAARLSYTLALGTDGNLYGWGLDMGIFESATAPWTPDGFGHFIAPRQAGEPYTAIAAGVGSKVGFGLIVALREDGSIVTWDPSGLMLDPPAGKGFTQVAAGLGYAVAIDQAGRLHAWGDPAHVAFSAVPTGVYSMVSAATNHATAIFVPDTTPPVITILGQGGDSAAPLMVERGSIYVDAGATAFDVRDGDLTASIMTSGTVDTATPGPYEVTYTVSDAAGNSAANHRFVVVLPPLLTALNPAQVWVGLKNSDDVGTKFDLLAEVFKNGTSIGSGQLNDVSGGSSGFNNARIDLINLALSQAVRIATGDTLTIRLSVRVAATSGHRSGTARLWFNDAAANSGFGAVIAGGANTFFLRSGSAMGTSAGPGPKETVDVLVDRAVGGNPFKTFGAWSLSF